MALARTSGFCQFCGHFAQQVHHVRYPKQFGEEHPHSLVPVCDRCHRTSHGIQKMKALFNVSVMREPSPTGTELRYLLTGKGRVYATAASWAKALQVPASMMSWFEGALARTAMVKGDFAGGELEMTYMEKVVYRWHAVAETLRSFDRQFYDHGFRTRPTNERNDIEKFHRNFERVVSWGYDLQERALSSLVEANADAGKPVTQTQLVDAMKEAVAPRLRQHDEQIREHSIFIEEIREAVPTLRDEGEFITVKQAITEKGLDASQMPLWPKRETLSGVAGQTLKSKGAEQGVTVPARLDGQAVAVPMNTYKRGEIYTVLDEIQRIRPQPLL